MSILKTKRICSKRMSEHDHSDPQSHVYLDNIKAGHKHDFEGVKILFRACNDKKLLIKRNAHDKKKKSILNKTNELGVVHVDYKRTE